MELATLYARYGQDGIERLADEATRLAFEAAGVEDEKKRIPVVYLQKLLYVLTARPSMERANLLITASKNLFGKKNALSFRGLSEPIYYKDAIKAAMKNGTLEARLQRKYASLAEEE